jgi:hypothetical protein
MKKIITIGMIVLVTLAVMGVVGQRSAAPGQVLPPQPDGRLDAYHVAALIMILITAAAIGRLLRRR